MLVRWQYSDRPCSIFMLDVQAVPMMFITSSQSVANIHSYRKQQLGKDIYKIHFYQFHEFEIRQSSIWYAGSLGRWVDCLIDQVSDGPSIILIDWK